MRGAVLVTGTSSGIGLETALYLAGRGFRVFAGMRDPSRGSRLEAQAARRGARAEILPLDLNDAASIRRAVDTALARAGEIRFLVNNAGVQLRGYFEDLADTEILPVFETNVFGTMELTRAVLPPMREARRGRIVLITSVGGRIGSPALSAYCASKFALEGFGECLALETAPWGVQVCLVEPAIIQTEIWGANRGVSPGALNPASPYAAWFRETEQLTDWAVRSSRIRPEHVARAVYRALTARRPHLRYVVGRRARALLTLRRLLPNEIFERMYFGWLQGRITKPHAPEVG